MPRAIRARRSLREVPRARLRRSRRPEGDAGAFLGPRDPAGRGRPPCGPAAPRRARMDSLGVARDPVSRGRARLHFPRSRPPVSRSAGPREPDRSDRPGRGPGDGGRDRPVSPRGVRGPRGDDRALPADGGVPRADDRGDPCPLLPRPVRPRAVRPRGGLDFPGGGREVALGGGKEAGLRADPAPRGVPRDVGRPDVPRRPGRGDRGPLGGETRAPALLPPPVPETALRRVPGTCGRSRTGRTFPPRRSSTSSPGPGSSPSRRVSCGGSPAPR